MSPTTMRDMLVEELPDILENEPEVQAAAARALSDEFANKAETESRFDRMLAELQRMREESERKWEENQRKWEENQRKWEENQRVIREMQEESRRKWEENQRKWEENQRVINEILESIRVLNRKYDQGIGALGARWGIQTEESFRSGLKGILEDFFNVEVVHVLEYDDEGMVFGRPDQIELDLIIKNGLLIIAELKSSMSKSDMYAFARKVEFYKKRHHREPDRVMVISPMVTSDAERVAKELGIRVYTYVEDVDEELLKEKGESTDSGE